MLKLCFPDGNEYELIEVQSSTFILSQEKPYPNFRHIKEAGEYIIPMYRYETIRFGGKHYGFKLINKDQI